MDGPQDARGTPQDAPLTAEERGERPVVVPGASSVPPAPPRPPHSRLRTRLAVAVLGVVLVGGAGAGLVSRTDGGPDASASAGPGALARQLSDDGFSCVLERKGGPVLYGCYEPDAAGGRSVRWQGSGDDPLQLRVVARGISNQPVAASVVSALAVLPGWDTGDTAAVNQLLGATSRPASPVDLAGWGKASTSTDAVTGREVLTLTRHDADPDDEDGADFHGHLDDAVTALRERAYDCTSPAGDDGNDTTTCSQSGGSSARVTLTREDGDLVAVDAQLPDAAVDAADLTSLFHAVARDRDARDLDVAVTTAPTTDFTVEVVDGFEVRSSPVGSTDEGRHIVVESVRW